MQHTLIEIEAFFSSHGRGEDFWNHGLERQEIEDTAQRCHRRISEDVINLYQWHNGQNYDWRRGVVQSFSMFPFQIFKDLKSCLIDRVSPFTNEWSETFWCSALSKDTSEVWCASEDIYEPFIIYSSLESMMNTVIMCFKEGVYVLDGEGNVDRRSMLEERRVALLYNPGVQYWEVGVEPLVWSNIES